MRWFHLASTLLVSTLCGSVTRAQNVEALETRILHDQARGGDDRAIRELGRRKDRSAVGILEPIANRAELAEGPPLSKNAARKEFESRLHIFQMNRARAEARVALARLGDRRWLDHFIVGLSSSNTYWRMDCIQALIEIGDRRAVGHLIPILSEEPPQGGNSRAPIPAFAAAGALKKLLPDVYADIRRKKGSRGFIFRDEWKDWWEKNKDKPEFQ